MKLSRASTYAFYGLSYIASQQPGRVVPLSEIHQYYKVPEKHLAKIFQTLVRAKILISSRGKTGGFVLARPAAEISPLDVIEAIEGPVETERCLLLQDECGKYAGCRINTVWRGAQQQMLNTLRQATLLDLVTPAAARGVRPARSTALPVLHD